MLEFLRSNLATILVAAALLAIVWRILLRMYRERSSGCGSCSGCAAAPLCQSAKQKPRHITK